jgi:hypothetical protein
LTSENLHQSAEAFARMQGGAQGPSVLKDSFLLCAVAHIGLIWAEMSRSVHNNRAQTLV